MRLTTKTQYALMALTYMKENKRMAEREIGGNIKLTALPIQIKEIGEKTEISTHFLEQIFRALRVAGLVKSVRGPGGGYILRSKEINYCEVLDAVDEKIVLNTVAPKDSKIAQNLGAMTDYFRKDMFETLFI